MNKQKQPSLPVLDRNCSYYPEHLQETMKGFKLILIALKDVMTTTAPTQVSKNNFIKRKSPHTAQL